jgi:signal transduction histidine kinase
LETSFDKNDTIGELVQGMNHMALELNRLKKMRQEFIANVSHEKPFVFSPNHTSPYF